MRSRQGLQCPNVWDSLRRWDHKGVKTPHGGSGGRGRTSGTQAWNGRGPRVPVSPSHPSHAARLDISHSMPSFRSEGSDRHSQCLRSVGLQGVGQVLLKLLVKLPSPALAWIPEPCGAGCTVQKLRAVVETPALSFPTCSLSPP